jgi:hypothetical protein
VTVLDETVDPEGRRVVLDASGWEHTVRRHPEMAGHRLDVVRVVADPHHRGPDPRLGRERFWKFGEGPSSWLMVVVDFTGEPARILTAYGNRKDPPGWTP